ncbi:hypothetical protein LGM72_20680, partial [Burkholderia contaminans]|uniref:hypothetical protein n=1 Tax=Burkholderia contaminans TaxID=488447 RepID=UPI001CF3FB07
LGKLRIFHFGYIDAGSPRGSIFLIRFFCSPGHGVGRVHLIPSGEELSAFLTRIGLRCGQIFLKIWH